ncbi:unnamed protein product [Symbiodinium pilosum]|uniref:EF-hand domain-containing protein n=1 Tax=Symbiodinium pilosum TaxID=2952 RepID=A0A812XGC8_SYMPI|nr:unnamed protein product [Symbiodinium pilosum]
MLIGVLCQVVEDNSREHEKQQILVDLKTSLEEAFEALDTSHDGIISEEEFQKMKANPKVMEIFARLGMEESAIIQRLDHMQETIFAPSKNDDADESFLTDSKALGSRRPPSLSFNQFADQVVELQMNNSAGVLDVQMLASKVRAEDQKVLSSLARLESDVQRLLKAPMDTQESKTTSIGLHTLNLSGEDSVPVRFPSAPLPCREALQASQHKEVVPEEPVQLPGELGCGTLLPGALDSDSPRVAKQAALASSPSPAGPSEMTRHEIQQAPEVPEVRTFITKEGFELREDWLQEDSYHCSLTGISCLRFFKDKLAPEENLGGTDDAYECLDFSDNDLIKLGNFPPLKRLRVLMLMNNRISRIAPDCFDPIPNIVSLVLTGNKLEKLVDLEPITQLKNLERLSLMDNPVTKVKHFRPYMIHKSSKTLRILDFNRIKDKERKAATLLFAGERGKKLLEEIAPPRVVGKEPTEKVADVSKSGPSPEVIERIKKAIAEAETIEEVTRLEKALKSGILPDDLKEPGTEGPEPAPGVEGGAEPMAEG